MKWLRNWWLTLTGTLSTRQYAMDFYLSNHERISRLESSRGEEFVQVGGQLSDLYNSLDKLRDRVHALEHPSDPSPPFAERDLAPALRQLVAYIVVSAYRGSDQEGVMAAIEEVWGPIKEHLEASGVLAKEEA